MRRWVLKNAHNGHGLNAPDQIVRRAQRHQTPVRSGFASFFLLGGAGSVPCALSFVALISLLCPYSAGAENDSLSIEAIVAKLQQASGRQRSQLCAYSVIRRYTLCNKRLYPNARMDVRLTYKAGEGKQFEVISTERLQGLTRRVLVNLLKAEERSSKTGGEDHRVDPSNYQFAFLGMDEYQGRRCYRLRLLPRRKTEYLIQGEVWIDAEDYTVVQIRGQLAKSPSFWTSKPEVDQRFEKVGQFWMPSYNRTVASVKLVGEVDLTIEYFNYELKTCGGL
jgi:hypothetical protein